MLRVMRHNSAGFYSIGPCRSSSNLLTLLFLERAFGSTWSKSVFLPVFSRCVRTSTTIGLGIHSIIIIKSIWKTKLEPYKIGRDICETRQWKKVRQQNSADVGGIGGNLEWENGRRTCRFPLISFYPSTQATASGLFFYTHIYFFWLVRFLFRRAYELSLDCRAKIHQEPFEIRHNLVWHTFASNWRENKEISCVRLFYVGFVCISMSCGRWCVPTGFKLEWKLWEQISFCRVPRHETIHFRISAFVSAFLLLTHYTSFAQLCHSLRFYLALVRERARQTLIKFSASSAFSVSISNDATLASELVRTKHWTNQSKCA